MRYLLTLLCVILFSVSNAQTEVKAEDLKSRVGDTIKFCGKVFTARLMERSAKTPTFINIDAAYPNQVLTLVVWGEDRKNFKNQPEEFYLNKKVCIVGKLETFKDQLQIVIHSEEQLTVIE
jgi:hypothetical protein